MKRSRALKSRQAPNGLVQLTVHYLELDELWTCGLSGKSSLADQLVA